MSTRVFFLNSDTTLYGEEEINAISKLFIDQGVLNTLEDNFDDWAATGDLKVTERGAGANMSVDVAPGWAIIETVRNAKTFKIFVQNIAIANLAVAANSSGSNRVDAVIARVSRSIEPNLLANNILTLEVVLGDGVTALSDNDISTAIGGDDFLRLADITVPNATADIEDGDIADTRVAAQSNQAMKQAPKVIFLGVLASDPSVLSEGMLWYNETTHTLNFYNGTSTIQLGGAAGGFDPLKPTAQSTPDMTVAVASGEVRIGSKVIHYAGGNSGSFTAPVTGGHKRIDLLALDETGTLQIVQGTSTAGAPTAPNYPPYYAVLAEIYLRNGMTSIKDTDDSTNGYISRDTRGLTVVGDKNMYVAGENITALDAAYINLVDAKVYRAHGFKQNTSNAASMPGSNEFEDWRKLSDVYSMMLYYSSNTLSIRIWSKSTGTASSQTVTTSFQSSSHNNNLTRAAVARIDNSKFVVFYTKTSSSDKLYYRTGSISGGTITMDTETLFTGSPDYVYCIVAANGNADGKVGLSFAAQPSGIGSSSTLTHYVHALTVATNSVTSNYSVSSITISSGFFFPQASWNSIVATDNGQYIAILDAQDSGGTYNLYMSAIDSNTGTTGTQGAWKPNQDAQGTNRYTNRAWPVAHDERYVAAFYESDQYTGGSFSALNLIIADINGMRLETMQSNGHGSSLTDVRAERQAIFGGQHGVVIPGYRAMYRKGKFYTFPAITSGVSSNRWNMSGIGQNTVVYHDGSNIREAYVPTLFDGFAAWTVSAADNEVLLTERVTGMTLTANRRYFLKNGFTNPGEIDTAGVTQVGRSLSSSIMQPYKQE